MSTCTQTDSSFNDGENNETGYQFCENYSSVEAVIGHTI